MTEIAERAAELARELAGPGAREPVVVVVVVTGSPVPDGPDLDNSPPWD